MALGATDYNQLLGRATSPTNCDKHNLQPLITHFAIRLLIPRIVKSGIRILAPVVSMSLAVVAVVAVVAEAVETKW
jgi:hypothetical protein